MVIWFLFIWSSGYGLKSLSRLFLTILESDKSGFQISTVFIFPGSSRIHHPEQPERQSSDPDFDSSLNDHWCSRSWRTRPDSRWFDVFIALLWVKDDDFRLSLTSMFMIQQVINYNGDLNNVLVPYSDQEHLSHCEFVHYSEHHFKTGHFFLLFK